MATVKYSLGKGERQYNVTKAAGSAVTKDIELTVEDAVTKQEIIVGLQSIIEYIVKSPAN